MSLAVFLLGCPATWLFQNTSCSETSLCSFLIGVDINRCNLDALHHTMAESCIFSFEYLAWEMEKQCR